MYAPKKNATESIKSTAASARIPQEKLPTLSANAPEFKPLSKNEITFTPSNYEANVKNIEKWLASTKVARSRKSENGNIVLSFPTNETMKSAQGILEGETGIKLHIPTKSLPKMATQNIELADGSFQDKT